jgi:mono/diheme cytochrome c family protein
MGETMKRWLWWIGGALLALVVLAAVAVAIGWQLAERKQQRRIDVKIAPLAVAAGAVSVERGRYLYNSRGCADCHGANGGGRTFVDDGSLVIAGPQIAPGKRSATAAYTELDWVRTIRHGVKPDGRPALIMPSEDYNRFTDADLASLVAYVKQMPAVDGAPAMLKLPLPLRLAYAFGAVRDAAEKIDHALPPQTPVAEGVTVEHGKYVANMCIGCHGEHLSGGKIPGGPPDWPAAANLTPGSGSAMPNYPDAKSFAAMFKSGRRPDGSTIGVMPFESLRAMSDVDVAALHLYLKSLPPRAAGGR